MSLNLCLRPGEQAPHRHHGINGLVSKAWENPTYTGGFVGFPMRKQLQFGSNSLQVQHDTKQHVSTHYELNMWIEVSNDMARDGYQCGTAIYSA